MNMRVSAIAFLVLGVVFVLFSRKVTSVFRWLEKKAWDEESRRRFPHLAPRGEAPRSATIVLGVSWIVGAVIVWFISQAHL